MKTRHVVGFIGASILSLVAVDASAGNTDVTQRAAAVSLIGTGNMGRLEGEMQRRGPGFEQSDVVTINKDGKQYVVVVTMQSFDDHTAPWQCSCSSFEMQPTGAPKEVVHLNRLTNYVQDGRARVCNHPRIATDGDTIGWVYGSDYQANRPKTYAGVLNHMCQVVVAPTVMSEDPNENEGAPDLIATGPGKYLGGYLSQGGNNTDQVYSFAFNVAKQPDGVTYALAKTWLMSVIAPANIGRPTIKPISDTRALFCAAEGQNRPPDHGITCAILDTATGNSVWKNTIAPSYMDKDGTKHYMNQPTLAKLSDGHYALQVIETNAMGQNTNLKGANIGHTYTMDLQGDAIVLNGHLTGAAEHQTHSTLCAGGYGPDGAPHMGIISAAPTGIGRPAMVMLSYDATNKQFLYNKDTDMWPVGWYGDSGHLANWYGENPMRQGRDFLRCIGDVPNPGYHVDGGYMPDVASFFVAAIAGRVPGDYKNSLFLSFIPGKADTISSPQNPVPVDQVPPPTTDNSGNQPQPQPSSTSGCACNTPGTRTDSGTMFGGLALLGLAIGAVRRRKS